MDGSDVKKRVSTWRRHRLENWNHAAFEAASAVSQGNLATGHHYFVVRAHWSSIALRTFHRQGKTSRRLICTYLFATIDDSNTSDVVHIEFVQFQDID